MKTKREDKIDAIGYQVAEIISWLLWVGMVWIYAWIFNPSLNSNTVWFVAVLFASLMTKIAYKK
jgi:hypothetical protein